MPKEYDKSRKEGMTGREAKVTFTTQNLGAASVHEGTSLPENKLEEGIYSYPNKYEQDIEDETDPVMGYNEHVEEVD